MSETGHVYVLRVALQMGKNIYYVVDLKGSLSRNIQDSMLFCSEIVAESYAGKIEHLLEEQLTTDVATPTVSIERVTSTGIVPRTVFEGVPCP